MMQARSIVGNPEDSSRSAAIVGSTASADEAGVSQQQAKAALQPFMHSMLESDVSFPPVPTTQSNDATESLEMWMTYCQLQGRSYTRRQLHYGPMVMMATTV